jgi:hypothetical protein
MNLRKCLVVVLIGLGSAVAAQAQLGLYVGYTADRITGVTCFAIAPGQCATGTAAGAQGPARPSGILGGVYYDFRNVGPVRLGLDLRGGDLHSNKSATSSAGGTDAIGYDNVLLGVRGSIKTKYTWLTPYAQVSAGYARSNVTEPTGTQSPGSLLPNAQRYEDNFLMYEGFVGMDIHVFSTIDLRPVELGIGGMNRIGSGNGPSSLGIQTISAGIVLHLPRPE